MQRFLTVSRILFQQPGFLGLLAATFALGTAYSFVAPLLSIWGTEQVGMSPVMFGLFMTITSFSAIVVGLVLARWSDTKVSRRSMLILTSASGVLGYCGYALVKNPIVLIAIGSTTLAMASCSFSQLFAHVRERFEINPPGGIDTGFIMSVVRVTFSISWTAGPAIGAWTMGHYGFRAVFLAAAGLFFLFLIGVIRSVPHQAHPVHAREAARVSVRAVLGRGDVIASFAAFVLFFAANALNIINLPLRIKGLGGTDSDFGIIFGIGPVVEIPLMLWFGQLAARGHRMRLIRIGAATTALYFVTLSFSHAVWHIYFAQILSGVVFAIMTNVAIVYFQDFVPGQLGLATTLYSNSGSTGNLIGYFSFGGLFTAMGAVGVFQTSAISAALCLGLLFLYPGPQMKRAAVAAD